MSDRLSARARRRRVVDPSSARATPSWLFPPAALGFLFLFVPTLALLVRMPWSDLRGLLAGTGAVEALRLSLITATASLGVSLLLGLPLALLFARSRLPGLGLLRTIVLIPLVFPPVAGGVVLFLSLGRRGIIGEHLDTWFGYTIPFTLTGVIVANTFVAMPYLILTMEGAFRNSDRRYEQAALTLGASRWTVFRRLTIPMVAPSLAAGSLLTWSRALGEFGATVTFNGALQGRTATLPVQISTALDESQQQAEALSLVLLLVCLIVLGLLRDRWLRPAPGA